MFLMSILDMINIAIALWVGLSAGAAIVDNLIFYFELKRLGVPVHFMNSGLPFYLISKYNKYKNCTHINLSSLPTTRIYRYKWLSKNAVLSAIVAFLWFGLYILIREFAEVQ